MKYLDPKFSVGPAAKSMPGTCEACVWGRGEHSDGCSEEWRSGLYRFTDQEQIDVWFHTDMSEEARKALAECTWDVYPGPMIAPGPNPLDMRQNIHIPPAPQSPAPLDPAPAPERIPPASDSKT